MKTHASDAWFSCPFSYGIIIFTFNDLFRLLYDEVDDWGAGHLAECILVIARYELSDGQVVDKEINAMAMLIELLTIIK